MFQGFVSPGVEQLVYVVVHEWFQVQQHDLYCSGMMKIVVLHVIALACAVVVFESKGFSFTCMSCSKHCVYFAHNLCDLWNLTVCPL